MPFITSERIIQVKELRAKIEQPVLEDLEKYAQFLKSSQPYVVQELLRKAMAKDKEFQAHLAGKPEKVAPNNGTGRSKKGEEGPQPVKSAVA